MVRLVQKEWGIETTRESFVKLEEQIIHLLDFSFLKTGPLFYLERYLRLMNLDGERDGDQEAASVARIARQLLRCILLSSSFLRYSSSQVAATALLFSIAICQSASATVMGAENPYPGIISRVLRPTH